MTAKPQSMAAQSDGADDLIAELAKLMAQDAKTDRPADAPAPPFAVRIPGGDAPALGPVPRFDLGRPASGAATPAAPAAPAARVEAAAPVEPAPVKPATEEPLPEPFRFDFNLNTASPSPGAATSPVPPAPAAPAPTPEPVPVNVEPAKAADSTVDYDSIADLIAAELAADSSPTPRPAPAPPPVAPTVSPAAAQANTGWTPAAVQPAVAETEAEPEQAIAGQPAPRSQADTFKVPPVFGLAGRATPTEPSVAPVVAPTVARSRPQQPDQPDDGLGRDPIDEIESLIGRAMRVEFDAPEDPAAPVAESPPAPSPALRSLATPVVPAAAAERRTSDAPRTLSGADEAILAAAQATGAEIGWVEAPGAAETTPVPPPPRQRSPRSMSRAVAGPLVAVTLLLAAGFGLYWVLGLGSDPGPAPLLTADAGPTKETPAVQPDAATTQQSVVFNEIDGVVPGAEEQLVSRDQADLNEVTQVPPAAGLSEEGLANRKVRTVTVRPDGTIVSGEDSVAGSAILPVDRPNVPNVPGAETTEPSLLAATEAPNAATAVDPIAAAIDSANAEAEAPGETVAAAPAPATTPVQPGSTVPAVDVAGNALAGRTAPIPLQRPAGLQATAPTAATSPVNAVIDAPSAAGGNMLPPPPAASTLGALTPQPAAQPAAAPSSAATASSTIPGAVEVDALPNSAAAYAQLASLRTEEEARQAAQNLVNRFGPLFGGANMEVQRVDLGARGIYYRVRVPANSREAANNICTNVVAAGGDCVLM